MMVCSAVAPRALLLFWLLDALLFTNASRPKDGEHADVSSLILASSGHMISSSHKAATDAAAKPGPYWADAFTNSIRDLSETMVHNPGAPAQAERNARHADRNARHGVHNDIAQTGYHWMKEAQTFRTAAGDMRKHADEVYGDVVKSHEVAAKKQLKTFKEEITKLDPALAAHSKVSAEAEDGDETAKATAMLKAAGYPVQERVLEKEGKVPAQPQRSPLKAPSNMDQALQTLAFRSKAAAKGDKSQKDIEHIPIAQDIKDVRQSAVEEAQKSIMSIPHV